MTRVFEPPLPLEVEVDPDGRPAWITRGPLTGRLEPHARWLVQVDWWLRPVDRECWRAEVGRQLLVELFRDLHEGAWFLERVYD